MLSTVMTSVFSEVMIPYPQTEESEFAHDQLLFSFSLTSLTPKGKGFRTAGRNVYFNLNLAKSFI